MQQFPDLKDGQIAIVRAEFNTGIILDENHKRSISKEQIVFTVFDSLEKAVKFAKIRIQENKDIEFVLYEKSEHFIARLDRDNINMY